MRAGGSGRGASVRCLGGASAAQEVNWSCRRIARGEKSEGVWSEGKRWVGTSVGDQCGLTSTELD